MRVALGSVEVPSGEGTRAEWRERLLAAVEAVIEGQAPEGPALPPEGETVDHPHGPVPKERAWLSRCQGAVFTALPALRRWQRGPVDSQPCIDEAVAALEALERVAGICGVQPRERP